MIEKVFNLIGKVHNKFLKVYSKNDLNIDDNIYFKSQKDKKLVYGKNSNVVVSNILVGNKIFYIYARFRQHGLGVVVDISDLKYHSDIKTLKSKGLKNAKWEYNHCIRIDQDQDVIYEKIREQVFKFFMKLNKREFNINKENNLELEFNEKFKKMYKDSPFFLTSLNDAYINHEKKILGDNVSFAKTSSKRVSKL